MDQLICASLSHSHYYWYDVGMLKVPAENTVVVSLKKNLHAERFG